MPFLLDLHKIGFSTYLISAGIFKGLVCSIEANLKRNNLVSYERY